MVWGHQHYKLAILSMCTSFTGPILIFVALSGQPIIALISFLLIVAGSLVPDSDSENKGSKIFYTIFKPFAIYYNWIEKYLAKILRKPIGHRQSLHTITGSFISSFFLFLILSPILNTLGIHPRYSAIFFYSMFYGQLTHIVSDKIKSTLFISILIILLSFVFDIILIILFYPELTTFVSFFIG
jgi:hypothetical protein